MLPAPVRRPLRGVPLARGAPGPPAGARGSRPAASPPARPRRRFRSSSRCRSSGGYSASSPAAISARPEWRATSGGEPQAAASAATMPNASGNADGVTPTSASGHRCARWRCSSGPVKSTRHPARRRLELVAHVAPNPTITAARPGCGRAPRRAGATPFSSAEPADEDDGRARRRRGTLPGARRCPSSGSRWLCASGGFGGSRSASASSAGSASSRGRGLKLVDVDAGRDDVDAVEVRRPARDLLDHPLDVLRAGEDGLRRVERLPRPVGRAPRCRASRTRAPSRAP